MSKGETEARGGDLSGQPDWQRLVGYIFVLLNHLQRQSDNRLQAQFDDTHLPEVRPVRLATPPCASYADFQTRLTRIRETGVSATPSGKPEIDDLTFLRWSKDFLSAVAAPATVESISITREYMRARAERGATGGKLSTLRHAPRKPRPTAATSGSGTLGTGWLGS